MILVEINATLKLAPIEAMEVAAYSEKAWQQRRVDLLRTLDDAQAGEELRVKELKDLDRLRRGRGPAIGYAFSIPGAIDIITGAAKAQGHDPVEAIRGVKDEDLTRAALELIHFKIPPEKDADAGE